MEKVTAQPAVYGLFMGQTNGSPSGQVREAIGDSLIASAGNNSLRIAVSSGAGPAVFQILTPAPLLPRAFDSSTGEGAQE